MRSVAIIDHRPAFTAGLAQAFRVEGWNASTFRNMDEWAGTGTRFDGVVVTAHGGTADAVERLATFANEAVTVLLVEDPIAEDFAVGLASGVQGVASLESLPEAIVRVLTASMDGWVMVPLRDAQQIGASALSHVRSPDTGVLSPDELQWLTLLASGATVAKVAARSDRSERSMYRALDALFRRIGAANRYEAIASAARANLLELSAAMGRRAHRTPKSADRVATLHLRSWFAGTAASTRSRRPQSRQQLPCPWASRYRGLVD